MSVNINLADKRNPDESKKEKANKLRGISFAVLILTAFLSILIFVLDYRFSASYVKKQEADLLKELEPYADTSANIFIINSKLDDISTILSQRKKYSTLVTKIAAGNSGGVNIDDFLIDSSGTKLTVSATSLASIDEFINAMLDLAKNHSVTNVTLKSLSLQGDKYIIELIII